MFNTFCQTNIFSVSVNATLSLDSPSLSFCLSCRTFLANKCTFFLLLLFQCFHHANWSFILSLSLASLQLGFNWRIFILFYQVDSTNIMARIASKESKAEITVALIFLMGILLYSKKIWRKQMTLSALLKLHTLTLPTKNTFICSSN